MASSGTVNNVSLGMGRSQRTVASGLRQQFPGLLPYRGATV